MTSLVLDMIWNISLICPWDCEFCCTDAVQVTRRGQEIHYREESLQKGFSLDLAESESLVSDELRSKMRECGQKPNIYDIALAERQRRGAEATLEQKLAVLRNVASSRRAIWDFAGGDPLVCFENFVVMQRASELFGRESISVTSTGAGFERYRFQDLAQVIGRYEFTYDEPGSRLPLLRPVGYNRCSLAIASRLSAAGIRTKAQVPIHTGNVGTDAIDRMYDDLAKAGITEVLLMRTFPSGRGSELSNTKLLSADNLRESVQRWQQLADGKGGPSVRLQCALRMLDSKALRENPCDLVRKSFGINPKGQLLASAWATNSIGGPLSDDWVLGDLTTQPMDEILDSEKVRRYIDRLDQNFGHCKIFAYIHSKGSGEQRMFDRSDPLYAPAGLGN